MGFFGKDYFLNVSLFLVGMDSHTIDTPRKTNIPCSGMSGQLDSHKIYYMEVVSWPLVLTVNPGSYSLEVGTLNCQVL